MFNIYMAIYIVLAIFIIAGGTMYVKNMGKGTAAIFYGIGTLYLMIIYGIKWFGIPMIEGLGNDEMREVFKMIHDYMGYIILALFALHLLGVIKHTFINKDGVLKRMTFK